MKFGRLLFAIALSLYLQTALSSEQQCLLEQIEQADDKQTIGQLRAICAASTAANTTPPSTNMEQNSTEKTDSALSRRIALEHDETRNPFTLLPHKPNYILLSNNLASANEQPFEQASPNDDIHLQPWETKFQISLKIPVVRNLFNKADLFVAYTNRSFWQQFNKEGSAPFRDSNHEPEVWLSFKNNTELLGFQNRVIRTGISHQSNGQSGSLSRSWNRIYSEFIFERGDWYLSLKPWWRIPESNSDDDNPDIDDYMGNFELAGLYRHGKHNFDFLIRDNLTVNDNHGAIQLGWSFPISDNVRGYVQWFNGYGESLIDYDAYSNSIGFGVQLSDWL